MSLLILEMLVGRGAGVTDFSLEQEEDTALDGDLVTRL